MTTADTGTNVELADAILDLADIEATQEALDERRTEVRSRISKLYGGQPSH